jgi:hypothetical protein
LLKMSRPIAPSFSAIILVVKGWSSILTFPYSRHHGGAEGMEEIYLSDLRVSVVDFHMAVSPPSPITQRCTPPPAGHQ